MIDYRSGAAEGDGEAKGRRSILSLNLVESIVVRPGESVDGLSRVADGNESAHRASASVRPGLDGPGSCPGLRR